MRIMWAGMSADAPWVPLDWRASWRLRIRLARPSCTHRHRAHASVPMVSGDARPSGTHRDCSFEKRCTDLLLLSGRRARDQVGEVAHVRLPRESMVGERKRGHRTWFLARRAQHGSESVSRGVSPRDHAWDARHQGLLSAGAMVRVDAIKAT